MQSEPKKRLLDALDLHLTPTQQRQRREEGEKVVNSGLSLEEGMQALVALSDKWKAVAQRQLSE